MKNTIIVSGLTALILTGLVWMIAPKNAPSAKDVAKELQAYGAVSSPDIQSPYFSYGGVRYWSARMETLNSSTTPCAIQAPYATSTLIFGSFTVASTSGTATYVEFGKAANPYATTTSLGTTNIAANARATLLASTTPVAMNDDAVIFGASTTPRYFVVKVANAAYAQLGGTCSATWREN